MLLFTASCRTRTLCACLCALEAAETTEESSAEVSQPDENDIFGAPAATQQSPEGDLFGAPPEAQQVESKAADVPEQATANGLMADTAMSASAGPQQQQQQQQHSSGPLEKWRQERDEKLRALKEQEEEEKERLHQEARKEREQMWEKRNKEIEARHKTNINNEQTTVYDGTGNSNVWEGVLDLVDLQGDDSGSESKMRNLLLRLKRL